MDELASFAMEKPILRHLRAEREGKVPSSSSSKTKAKSRPLRPIILTRDRAQKEVFGLGYKNVPILSIEEFYDQRVSQALLLCVLETSD